MGQNASSNRPEGESAKDMKHVHLPNALPWWKEFKEFLLKLQAKEILSLDDYIAAFASNDPFKEAKNLSNLKNACCLLPSDSPLDEKRFMEEVLPWLATKALMVEELFVENGQKGLIKKLCKFKADKVTMTRQQVCCLMSLAFFNAFDVQGRTFNHFSLLNILTIDAPQSQRSKMFCLLQYYMIVMQAEAEGKEVDGVSFMDMNLLFQRLVLRQLPDWANCTKLLGPLLSHDGLIEDNHGALQADFANKMIGGGVLVMGNVQEEIRFMISPECLVSLLLCEEMEPTEAILISGAEQFSTYSGYGGGFKFTGPFKDPNPIENNTRCVDIVAMDATIVSFGGDEFGAKAIDRDLNKAYIAFSATTLVDKPDAKAPVATGNWGCGAFGGNKEMKTLIQWLAASLAERPLHYHTFSCAELASQQQETAKLLTERRATIGQLYQCMLEMDGIQSPFEVVQEKFSSPETV